jgi:hypothetical protein
LINNGKLLNIGEPQTIASEYEQLNLIDQSKDTTPVFEVHDAKILSVKINGNDNAIIKSDSRIRLSITYQALRDVAVAGSMSVLRADGTFLANSNTRDDPNLSVTKNGEVRELVCDIASGQFLPGTYRIDAAIYEGEMYLDRSYNAVQFTIVDEHGMAKGKGVLFKIDATWV